MVSAGVVGRPPVMVPQSGRPRLGEYGHRQTSDERTAPIGSRFGNGSTKGLMDSIWGTAPLGSGLGSMSRERSRNRENGSLLPPTDDTLDGKSGSGALVSSSESDSWARPHARSGWNANSIPTPVHPRSSEVSPVRHRSIGTPLTIPGGGASTLDSSQPGPNLFSPPRHSVPNNHTTTYKPLGKPLGNDNTNGAAFYHRGSDGFASAMGSLSRLVDVDSQTAIEANKTPWGDTASLHSPMDDRRRSVATSDYFAQSSTTASRSGSLPPSRHGSEPVQFPQNSDSFSRFPPAQPSSSRNNLPSLSQLGGRAYQDARSDSIHSETALMLERLSLSDHEPQPQVSLHKHSLSRNGFTNPNPFASSFLESGFPRQPPSEDSYSFDNQSLNNGSGTYTPNGYPAAATGERYNNYRESRADRGTVTPSTSSLRQSPYYSVGGTPPVFDHLYPSRGEATTRALINNNPALLESKLRALQQAQAQAFLDPLHPQYPQMLAQLRGAYNPYAYQMHSAMHMNGLTATLPVPMPVMSITPGMIVEAPKGPRQEAEGTSIMSALLNEFKSNNKNRRWELKDIYDHIVEFSGDQHGSRFIQHKLETANSDEKERVFREIQQNELQLMQDVFGNYVIQKFFEHGDQNQKRHLASRMKGRVYDLTRQMYGCRVVQKALEHILADQQAALIKELDGNVLQCVMDQNGNHVIQKAIERVPAEHIRFIVDAFRGHTKKLAVHPYGCRVIQRMLEHCEPTAKRQILTELHGCDANMFTDQYGNYVTQHMVEYGESEDRTKVIEKVKNSLLMLCRHKFASNVVEKCIALGTDDQRRVLMMKLCDHVDSNNPNSDTNLLLTIKDGYGNYVVQRLLDTLNPVDFAFFLERLQPEVTKVKKLIPGKHVVAVEKKMHRFDKPEQPASDLPPRTPLSPASVSQQPSGGTTPSLASPQSSSVPSTAVSSHSSADEPPAKETL